MSEDGTQFSAFFKAPGWFQMYKQGWEKLLKSVFLLSRLNSHCTLLDFNLLICKITGIPKSLPALTWIPRLQTWFIYNQTNFHTTYSQPSLSVGSACTDSTSKGLKLFLKIPESPQKQNLNLLHAGNYLHLIYIVFTTIYIAFILY